MLNKQKVIFRYESNRTSYFIYLLITCAYLYIEVSFNYSIIAIASDITSAPDDYKYIEMLGRVISTIGGLLFIFKRIHCKGGIINNLSKFGMFALFLVPTVYFGQKLLIDNLAEYSSGEERLKATKSNLEKNVTLLNTGELNPTQKINVATSPISYYLNPSTIKVSKSQLEAVSKHTQSKVIAEIFDRLQMTKLELDEKYHAYTELNNRSNSILKKVKADINVLWQTIKGIENKLWKEYQKIEKERISESKIKDLDRLLNSCQVLRCQGRKLDRYQRYVKNTPLANTLPEDWLPKDGKLPPEYFSEYSNKKKHIVFVNYYNKQYRKLLRKSMTGLDYTIKEKHKFISNKTIRVRVKRILKERMLVIDNSIPIDVIDESSFKSKMLEPTMKNITSLTGGLKLGLKRNEFITYVLNKEPLDIPLSPKKAITLIEELSRESFNQSLVKPLVIKKMNKLSDAITSQPDSYITGMEYCKTGINNVKGLIVIPFAISVSLFLIVMLSIDLIIHINRYTQINFSTHIETRTIYPKPFYYFQINPRSSILILFFVLLACSTYINSRDSLLPYAIAEVRNTLMNILWGVYYLGEYLNSYINIQSLAEPLVESLVDLDELVFRKDGCTLQSEI